MILVTGAVLARPDTLEEIRRLSLEHVRRSRLEAGCVSHAVQVDCEEPLRLCFVERWADAGALQAHFAVPESRGFVQSLRRLAAAPPELAAYQASPLPL